MDKGTPSSSKETDASKSTSALKGQPLKGLAFVLDTKLEKLKDSLKARIEKLGGKLTSRVSEKVAAVISARSNIELLILLFLYTKNFFVDKIKEMNSILEKAENSGIQVVCFDILDEFEAAKDSTSANFLIMKKNFAPWGTDVNIRLIVRCR